MKKIRAKYIPLIAMVIVLSISLINIILAFFAENGSVPDMRDLFLEGIHESI